jgi:hypothetical protein
VPLILYNKGFGDGNKAGDIVLDPPLNTPTSVVNASPHTKNMIGKNTSITNALGSLN